MLSTYKRNSLPPPQANSLEQLQESVFVATGHGVFVTLLAAFTFAGLCRWLSYSVSSRWNKSSKAFITCLAASAVFVVYVYVRRQWLHYLRLRVIENANAFITGAQNFEAVAAAGITAVQDVEIVSRGYNV